MDKLQQIFYPDTFWRDFILVMMGIISERLRQRWRNRDKNPYKWSCVDCREKGTHFYASCDNVEGLDIIILHHKRVEHVA